MANLGARASSRAPDPRTWKWIALLQLALICAAAIALALAFDPSPHSDWLYYWIAAGDASLYQRGGAGLGLLAALKALGASPVAASLCINVASAAALLWVAYRCDPGRWKWYAQLVAGMLLAVTPFYGIVQLDLVAIAFLAIATWFLAGTPGLPTTARFTCGILLAAVAVSTKPHLALVVGAMAILLVPVRWGMRRRWAGSADLLVAALLAGSLLGFVADYATRAAVGQQDSMRTTSAVTLYAGLLVLGEGRPCGYWSEEAAEAAKIDMRQPLARAVATRLAAEPPRHWAGVMACKLPEILLPRPFALNWLVESASTREQPDGAGGPANAGSRYAVARWMERAVYFALETAILCTVVVTAVGSRGRAAAPGSIAVAWIMAFWAVHAVFEIQGRYFLPMLLIAPILAALAARAAVAGGIGSAGKTGAAGSLS